MFRPDFNRAAEFVLRTFRTGKLGSVNLDIQVVQKLKKLDRGSEISRTPSTQKQKTQEFKELLKSRLQGSLPEKYVPVAERSELEDTT